MDDFQIEAGIRAALEDQVVEVVNVASLQTVEVRNIADGRTKTVAIGLLRPLPVFTQNSAAVPGEIDVTTLEAETLVQACRRRDAVADLDARGHPSRGEVEAKANELGCSVRTVYRCLRAHRLNPTLSAQVPKRTGIKPGSRLLDDDIERMVADSIEAVWLSDQKASKNDVYVEVRRRCSQLGLKPPSVASVRQRIDSVDTRTAVKRREGSKAARDRLAPAATPLQVGCVFDLLQLDHALVDLMLVDRQLRLPIGRPWLTVAIDCRTRVVAGLHLGFEPPSSISAAACISHAWLPKDAWLKAIGADASWPVWGQWKTVHLDNAREFRSEALRAGCHANQIIIEHRPVATPHYGGHIERLIGTFSQKIRLLPGATFSSVKERGAYRSDERAVLTFPEFLRWFVLEVEKYHHRPHRGLEGLTPLQAWQEALSIGGIVRPPPMIRDTYRFFLDFLPFERRRIRRDGISLFGTRYWSPALSPYIGSADETVVKYDPRDISRVYVWAAGGYVEASYADMRRPPISLAEHRFITRQKKIQNNDPRNEAVRFDAIGRQREIERAAMAESKRARRSAERRVIGMRQAEEVRASFESANTVAAEPDHMSSALQLAVEEWE